MLPKGEFCQNENKAKKEMTVISKKREANKEKGNEDPRRKLCNRPKE